MSTPSPLPLQLDPGDAPRKAQRFARENLDVTLGDFLAQFPSRSPAPLPPDALTRPLRAFKIEWVKIAPGSGHQPTPPARAPDLRAALDDLHAADVADVPATFPDDISEHEAVQIAYRAELQEIAKFLGNGLSVLVACDKVLTEYVYESVCAQAGRAPVLEDAPPPGQPESTGSQLQRAIQGPPPPDANLAVRVRSLKKNEVLVLRSLDMLDKPDLVEVLYQGRRGGERPQLLGFLDPSLEVRKVLTDRFAVHFPIMGLPRYIVPDPAKPKAHTVTRLLTAKERKCFKEIDPEGLYKNVAGLNAVQFRNAMRYVGATVGEGSEARAVYDEIRQFKRSSSTEIDIPRTKFSDIGGYDGVKLELQRLVQLVAGGGDDLDDEQRRELIPRGFIFHGPPGTGKTLFAKAVANELNATIQMVSGPEIMDKYVGQSESNLRHIFATARRNAPSVVVFDEFDSIAGQRSSYSDGGSRANNAVVAQLLTELDGFHKDRTVVVIGTTNRLDIIDEALLRPSRLKPVEVGRPDYPARRSVAKIHATSFKVDVHLRAACAAVLGCPAEWAGGAPMPAALREALLAAFPALKARADAGERWAGFARDLREFYDLVRAAAGTAPPADAALAARLEEFVRGRALGYGLDFTKPPAAPDDPVLGPVWADLRDLHALVRGGPGGAGLSADALFDAVLDAVAEFTDGFNNDEIRAVFQEASLEHRTEGQPITPRYLGTKVGQIIKRRDERDRKHLDKDRGR